jgi:hypothetical protein
MHTLTFFPLGNADCTRIELSNGRTLLFDYANMCCEDDPNDKRCNLPELLRDRLKATGKDYYDVVAYTHLDNDHRLRRGRFAGKSILTRRSREN